MAHAPVATITTRERQVTYARFDLPAVPLDGAASGARLMLTRRAWTGAPMTVGNAWGKWVYAQFVTTLPSAGCGAAELPDVPSQPLGGAGILADGYPE